MSRALPSRPTFRPCLEQLEGRDLPDAMPMTPPPSPPPPPPTATPAQLQEVRLIAQFMFALAKESGDINSAAFLGLAILRNEEQGLDPAVQQQMTTEFVKAVGLAGVQFAASQGGVNVPH